MQICFDIVDVNSSEYSSFVWENDFHSSALWFERKRRFFTIIRFFHQAFPLAFNRQTFQRVYDASDISKIAYRTKYCCRLKIYGAILATSTFDFQQKRQLKILMLVEDEQSVHAVNIGKRLLLQTIDTCKELENIFQIYAYVESTNLDGIHFYKMMGFHEREILEGYFPQRASLTPNAVKLEYQISMSRSNRLSHQNGAKQSTNSTIDNQESSSAYSPSTSPSEHSPMIKNPSAPMAKNYYFYQK